jgi:hypothetical protein
MLPGPTRGAEVTTTGFGAVRAEADAVFELAPTVFVKEPSLVIA